MQLNTKVSIVSMSCTIAIIYPIQIGHGSLDEDLWILIHSPKCVGQVEITILIFESVDTESVGRPVVLLPIVSTVETLCIEQIWSSATARLPLNCGCYCTLKHGFHNSPQWIILKHIGNVLLVKKQYTKKKNLYRRAIQAPNFHFEC